MTAERQELGVGDVTALPALDSQQRARLMSRFCLQSSVAWKSRPGQTRMLRGDRGGKGS